MIWRCPKCKNVLSHQSAGLVCSEGHHYDRSKQGYTHLLLANQKNSLCPGDSDVMISARRAFLRAGHYEPLINAIATIVDTPPQRAALPVLDLGCGEGYYLESLYQKLLDSPVSTASVCAYGVDISKVAVRKAAASAKQLLLKSPSSGGSCLEYAVASNANIPVTDACVDLVLTIFAPIVPAEVNRVLSAAGTFIRVAPGPRHLYQLREVIYESVSLHEPQPVEEGFVLEQETLVQYNLQLGSSEAIEQLLAMTPFNWKGKEESKKALLERGSLSVEIDFIIQVCRKGGPLTS